VQIRSKDVAVGATILGAVAFVYFVMFPQDLDSVLSPLGKVLALSTAVAPWLYLVVGSAILAWVIVRVWGRRSEAEPDRTVSPT